MSHPQTERRAGFVDVAGQTAKPFKWTYTGKALEA
jgi:hypothetical protein